MSMTEPTAVAVWDIFDPQQSAICFFARWDGDRQAEAAGWLAANLPKGMSNVVRIEFYLIDVPFAIVTRYETDDRNWIILDSGGRAGITDPVTVVLRELPPERLLRGEG
jgi:hypothetical protein